MKRTILFFMVISIIFTTSCGANTATVNNIEQEQFTYETNEIYSASGSKGVSSVAMGKNGELAVYNYYEKKIYIFDKDGTKVGETEVGEDWEGLLAFDNDNKLYVLLQHREKNEKNENVLLKRQLQIYDNQGNAVETQSGISEIKGESRYLTDETVERIEVDNHGNIYCLKVSQEVEVLDNKLKNIAMLQGKKFLDIALDEEDNLIGLCYDNGSQVYIEKVSGKDHKSIWKKEYGSDEEPKAIFYNKSTKTLYGFNEKGIFKYDDKGNIKGYIADAAQLSGLDNIYRFIVDEGEKIYIFGKDGSQSRLLTYIKTEKKEQEETEKKEIRLYSYYPNDDHIHQSMINVIRKFEQKYPDIKIKFEAHDNLQQINTELLTGKGPDILCGKYPAMGYITKGVFLDLNQMINEDSEFNREDYNEAVIEGSKYGDALYIMPITYIKQFYIGNKKLLEDNKIEVDIEWTWRDLYEIMEKVKSKGIYAAPIYPEEYILSRLVKDGLDYYIDWEKKEARFDFKEFRETLRLLKNIKSGNFEHPEAEPYPRNGRNMELLLNNTLFYPDFHSGKYESVYIHSPYSDNIILLPRPKPEYGDTKAFIAYNAGINSKSKYKDEAWEFIKFLLRDDIQSYIGEKDIPVNKRAGEKVLENQLERMRKYGFDADANLQAFKDINSSLNKNEALEVPDELFNTIWEEIKTYLSGNKSEDEVVKVMQNKVELYLNE
ncbi:extracellular solute-binding protein [Lutispora thermophila]|uniref:ABC-type glycerol-3-phosphate transport system, substrate-binding protein n=1 Tax=Lutispora thermophila DSM 19022 TaxID=1122184 RepID=A0A1M6DMS2_9FIRM|nr:extracellular solute-binding protein [Lutispora thermophila]SHI74490.1 ABC-type glycerol-3-phosphate transport system, substrate-binding protein [Lutispora thermophila DSM 19022]